MTSTTPLDTNAAKEPDSTSAEQTKKNLTEQLNHNTVTQDGSTTKQPDENTTKQPDGSTTKQPNAATAATVARCKTATMQYKTTTTQPDRNAVKQEVPVDSETGKPYINTVAAVAIAPSGVGAELSEYVSQAIAVIRDSGLPNETNAMFTNIEGDLDDVLHVVRDATMKLAGQGYRTGVTLKLDIRPGFSGQLTEKTQLVDELLDDEIEDKAEN